MAKDYDVVIIGSGPAGLAAALYCGRARLKTVLLEKDTLGGAIVDAELVENFPGFQEGILGVELVDNMMSQVSQYQVEFKFPVEVKRIDVEENSLKKVNTGGDIYVAKAVIIASGTNPKKLGVPGENEFAGQGVFNCVMCDGDALAGKNIAIVGGGDTGVTGALYMAGLGSKITIIEATLKLTATAVLQERLKAIPEVDVLCSTVVEGIKSGGNGIILTLKNPTIKQQSNLSVEGVFVLIGREPETDYLRDTVELDDLGFIKTTGKMETNVPGIFAAGDVRSGSVWQVITAAGDGATAAIWAERFINAKSW